MQRVLKQIILDDIYRYYGSRANSAVRKAARNPRLKYLIAYRKAHFYRNRTGFLKRYYKYRLRRLSERYLFQIHADAQIGNGLYLGHMGSIIINPGTVLGKNVNLAAGVTIGQTNRGERKGVPVIGDNVWIGSNAVVVGKITIGTDVLIAPNAYVNFDVPDHSVVIGNPGVIKPSRDACGGYVNNRV